MVVKEIPVVVNPAENVYFPSFPYPKDGIVLPLTETDEAGQMRVYAVQLPYWYWKLIIDYVVETEEAVTAITVERPP